MGRRNTAIKTGSAMSEVLVSGSLVLDTLFEVKNSIRDQIVTSEGKLGRQNLMFTASKKEVFFGGTAGNICYGLALQGISPLALSVVGKNFGEYGAHLKKIGVKSRIHIDPSGYTATFYGMTDPRKEQVGIFEASTYHKYINRMPLARLLKPKDWNRIAIAIFSPGTVKSIHRQIKEFKEKARKNAIVVMDPGQMLAVDFTPALFKKTVEYSDILIVNENEAHFLKTKFDITHAMLWRWGLRHYIVTMGNRGATLYEKERTYRVHARKARLVDPTGAGDAFRAGLIKGLLAGDPIEKAMNLGAELGATCVEHKGAQTYRLK